MQRGLLIVDVQARLEWQSREDRRIHVREAQSGMLAEDMSAARLAPLAGTIRGLVIRADVVRAASDAQGVRLPQCESVHGARRPMPARVAMAIAHRGWLASHDELDGSTKARSLVATRICHQFSPYVSIHDGVNDVSSPIAGLVFSSSPPPPCPPTPTPDAHGTRPIRADRC